MLNCPQCGNALENDSKNPGKLVCYECRRRFDEKEIENYWKQVEELEQQKQQAPIVTDILVDEHLDSDQFELTRIDYDQLLERLGKTQQEEDENEDESNDESTGEVVEDTTVEEIAIDDSSVDEVSVTDEMSNEEAIIEEDEEEKTAVEEPLKDGTIGMTDSDKEDDNDAKVVDNASKDIVDDTTAKNEDVPNPQTPKSIKDKLSWIMSEPKSEQDHKRMKIAKIAIISIAIVVMLVVAFVSISNLLSKDSTVSAPSNTSYTWTDSTFEFDGQQMTLGRTPIKEILADGWSLERPESVDENIPARRERSLISLVRDGLDRQEMRMTVSVYNPGKEQIAFADGVITKVDINYHEPQGKPEGAYVPSFVLADGVSLGTTTLSEAMDTYGKPADFQDRNAMDTAIYKTNGVSNFVELSLSAKDENSIITRISFRVGKNGL